MLNIQPKLSLTNGLASLRVMTRYHLGYRSICLLYVNTDEELLLAILQGSKMVEIERCSAKNFMEDMRQKTDSEILRMEDLERFKRRLGLANPVRFVYSLSKLRGDDERNP